MDKQDRISEKFRLMMEKSWASIYSKHVRNKYFNYYHRIFDILMKFLSLICQVDLNRMDYFYNSDNKIFDNSQSSNIMIGSKHFGLMRSDKIKPSIFIKSIRISYYFCCCYLINNVVFYYRYDWALYQYRWYKEYINKLKLNSYDDMKDIYSNDDDNIHNLTIHLNSLKELVDYNEQIIMKLGAPFKDLNFLVESSFIYIVLVTLFGYQASYLGNKFFVLDLSSMRFACNKNAYIKNYTKLVVLELNDFIESSRNFVTICLKSSANIRIFNDINKSFGNNDNDNNHKDMMINLMSIKESKLLKSNSPFKTISNHKITIKHLKSMALNGELIPMNRTSEFCDLLILWGSTFMTVLSISYTIFLLYYIITISSFVEIYLSNFSDIFVLIVFLFIGLLAASSLSFFLTAVVINSVDRIVHVTRLTNMIKSCVFENRTKLDSLFINNSSLPTTFMNKLNKLNNHQGNDLNFFNSDYYRNYYHYQQATNDISVNKKNDLIYKKESQVKFVLYDKNEYNYLKFCWRKNVQDELVYYDKLNKDLLYIIFQYRIFIRQLKINSKSMNFFSWGTLITISSAPILIVLQGPYLDKQLVSLSTWTFLFFILNGDCCLAPICYRHSKCLDLCKALFSLIAHLEELQTISKYSTIYSRDLDDSDYNYPLLIDKSSDNDTNLVSNLERGIVNNNSEQDQEQTEEELIKLTEPKVQDIYDMHVSRLIFKELSNLDILTRKFATVSLGLTFTFPNFIKFHVFSTSIIMYSILNNLYSSRYEQQASISNTFGFLFH